MMVGITSFFSGTRMAVKMRCSFYVCCSVLTAALVVPAAVADQLELARETLETDWAQRLEAIRQQRGDALQKKRAALVRYELERNGCYRKFLVTDCQEEARQRFLESTHEVRRLENEADAAERQIKKEKRLDKERRYLEEEPLRRAELRQREERVAQERARVQVVQEQKESEQREKARLGKVRHAQNAERLKQKRIRHERKVAEQMEKVQQPVGAVVR